MPRLPDNKEAAGLPELGFGGKVPPLPGIRMSSRGLGPGQRWSARARGEATETERLGPQVATVCTSRHLHPALAVLFAIVGSVGFSSAKPDAASPGSQVEHNLEIVHPGDASAKAVPHTLVQTFDAEGNPTAYSMWVDSVICRERVCDVVKVQLQWDALGRYQNYQVALGGELTKLDHVPFTQRDLAKLQEILRDTDSPLREVEKEAMIAKAPPKPKEGGDGVAAVSQPTVLSLKTAVIIGAGYTCYDLWHWANGLVTQQIRDLSGQDSSAKKLLAYLSGNDQQEAYFALEYLAERKIDDPAVFAAVVDRCKRGDPSLVEPTLAYLRQAASSDQVYYDAIVDLFSVPDSKKRVLILEDLSASSQQAVAGFYDQLCDYLPGLESYFEVHRFLTLMEKQNSGSAKVAEKAAELLEHEKFFISRRAYWFLEKQKLSADLQKSVREYHSENEDRL